MNVTPNKLLLLSASARPLAEALNTHPDIYDITAIAEAAAAMELLRDSDYDIIILDDTLLGSDTLRLVREIKRRRPLTPALITTQSADSAYHIDLLEAGTADILDSGLYTDELHRRLRLALQQRRQNLALARRNNNLQALAALARRLHAVTDPRGLLAEAIDMACRTFGLYGMAVALREGDMLHIFAGREGATPNTIFETGLRPHMYDPFMRVIDTGFVQTFQNIQQDNYYSDIPTLPRAESAVILPLAYPEYALGALAVFGSASAPVNYDDLVTYELFAAQLTTAYQNARHYAEQEKRVKTSAHMLKAWQRFVSLDTPDEIAAVLREMIEEIPSVNQALVWLYEDETADKISVRASSDELAGTFVDLYQRGHIAGLIEQMDDHMQVALQLGRGQKDSLGPLFRGLRGQHLMLFPITDSARITGGVLASAVGSGQFAIEDANLMKSLAHAAGQALVRTMLTGVMTEKGGRLEAILRSIYEGIVFVDNTGRVAFANTQFAELTAINPADILYREPQTLLDQLAAESADPDKTYQQLHSAVISVLDDSAGEDYPILEIPLASRDREINVEFARITGTVDSAYLGWIAIVRDSSRFKHLFSAQMSLLDIMSERIRVPHAELRGLVTTLIESHNRLNNSERARFLRRVEKNVEAMGELWENFLDIYHLELTGLVLEREESDLYDILQRALESRIFSENRRQFQVEAPARLPLARVDELRIERALSNVLQSALALSPPGAPIKLRLEGRGAELRVYIHAQGVAVPQNEVERLFDPLYQFNEDGTTSGLGLGLYLARELAERHGGRLWAECAAGKGTSFTLALPTSDGASVVTPPAQAESAAVEAAGAPDEARSAGYSVQKRQPKTIMVIEGKSSLVNVLRARLDAQGYEILTYRSSEEALRDLNAVRLDLIVLDVNLPDANSLDVCDRIRKRSQVPIIMLADEASEAEEVRALQQFGADAFITRPISEERLLARVDVILKRVADLPVRTRDPLDLGDLVIDFARREVYLSNKPIELTRIEYDLLNALALNENQVLTHKQLLDKVWGPEYQAETQYLWVNVSRLRKKLEPTPDSSRYIYTQQGVGYVFRRP